MTVEHRYRFQDKRYADYDRWAEYDQPSTSTLVVEVVKFEVVKHTPKGVWLDNGRWVSNHTKKQFACPDIHKAYTSFIARKDRQVLIHSARLKDAKKAISLGATTYEKEIAKTLALLAT